MAFTDDTLIIHGWKCPYCGAPSVLAHDSQIYGRSYGGFVYVCWPCRAWVGCYKGTTKSLGRLADKTLRHLKHLAHEAFDPIWKEGHLPRTEAYRILSIAFELPPYLTHIGMFDEDLCDKVIRLSKVIMDHLNQNNKVCQNQNQDLSNSISFLSSNALATNSMKQPEGQASATLVQDYPRKDIT